MLNAYYNAYYANVLSDSLITFVLYVLVMIAAMSMYKLIPLRIKNFFWNNLTARTLTREAASRSCSPTVIARGQYTVRQGRRGILPPPITSIDDDFSDSLDWLQAHLKFNRSRLLVDSVLCSGNCRFN